MASGEIFRHNIFGNQIVLGDGIRILNSNEKKKNYRHSIQVVSSSLELSMTSNATMTSIEVEKQTFTAIHFRLFFFLLSTLWLLNCTIHAHSINTVTVKLMSYPKKKLMTKCNSIIFTNELYRFFFVQSLIRVIRCVHISKCFLLK